MDPLEQLRRQKEKTGAKNKAISEIVTPDKLKVEFGNFAPERGDEVKKRSTAKTVIFVAVAALIVVAVVLIATLLL